MLALSIFEFFEVFCFIVVYDWVITRAVMHNSKPCMKANINENHFTLISLLNKRDVDNTRYEMMYSIFKKRKTYRILRMLLHYYNKAHSLYFISLFEVSSRH